MAEIILKSKLKLAGINTVRVSSAGLMAEENAKMSKNSMTALKMLGLKPYGFKSRQITADMIKKSALVLCMTNAQKECLSGFTNVYTIDELCKTGEISDPFGQDLKTYVKTSHQLEDACNVIIKKILKATGEQ